MGTISNKRGSARGAPPDVYLPFGSFHNEGDDDACDGVIDFFIKIFKGLGGLLMVIIFLVLYYAIKEGRYTNE
jgi:hypothetical protein